MRAQVDRNPIRGRRAGRRDLVKQHEVVDQAGLAAELDREPAWRRRSA